MDRVFFMRGDVLCSLLRRVGYTVLGIESISEEDLDNMEYVT